VAAGGRDREEFGKYLGAMLALCLALLELLKAKGGPTTGLARVPGGAGEVRVARSVA
jgi:hypothetical protein